MYVREIRLNGTRLDSPFFRHSDIMQGGVLEFYMTDKPVLEF
jgi:putative alpha-1,2-mannosidase